MMRQRRASLASLMTRDARRAVRLSGSLMLLTSTPALALHLAGALDLGRDSWAPVAGLIVAALALTSMGRVGVSTPGRGQGSESE